MTLSLLTPTGAVTTVPGHGVIAVRLADYVDPAARGTLSVVSDSLSVAGNVVKEEQTIAVQTTQQDANALYALASDTIEIPVADFGMDPLLFYNLLISMRMEGEAPSTAWQYRTWAGYQPQFGSSVGWAFGQGTSMYAWPDFVARGHFPQYHIYDMFTWANFGSDPFKIRGWGVTGGTIAMYFDMLYLVPIDGRGAAPDWYFNDYKTYYPDEPFDLMRLTTNGVVNPDQDNDTASAPWLGKHSAMTQGFPFTDHDTTNDYQEAEDEMSTYNVNGFGQWDGTGDPPFDSIADPPSWFAAVVGSTYATSHNIMTEPFSQAAFASPWVSPERYRWDKSGNLGGIYQPGNLIPGWYANAGTAICYVGAGGVGNAEYGVLRCGTFPGGSANPSLNYPVTRHLESRIMMCKLRFNTVWRSSLGIGMTRESINNAVQELMVGADCQLSAGGSLDLRLFSWRGSGQTAGVSTYDGTVTFGSPSTVNITSGYTAGTWFWVKVEKRGYFWRAKAWLDGNSEPGSWQTEGQEPLYSRNTSGSVLQPILYPYDTNWIAAGADADLVEFDPRLRGGNQIPTSTFYPTIAVNLFTNDTVTPGPSRTVEADDLTVDYDPDGSTPDDYSFKLEKYDATFLDGDIAIPWGSDRIVLGNVKNRAFNLDTDGYNPWIWKDGGDIPLQASGMSVLFERRKNNLFQWGDVKFGLGEHRLSGVDA